MTKGSPFSSRGGDAAFGNTFYARFETNNGRTAVHHLDKSQGDVSSYVRLLFYSSTLGSVAKQRPLQVDPGLPDRPHWLVNFWITTLTLMFSPIPSFPVIYLTIIG